ncbi:hypothetical protein JMUB7514_27440 [Staphylococcus aureus]
MTGETVVYKNEMNLVPLRRFTATEINLFFAMCNKLKEQDTNTCLLYTSPSPRDYAASRMPSSA